MRTGLVLAMLALPFAACSGVSNYQMQLLGDHDLNPNEEEQPNTVRVQVLMLKGEEAKKAFQSGDFDSLWSDAAGVLKDALFGVPVTKDVKPNAQPMNVILEQVPAEVTHFGVLALFNRQVPGKDRVVLDRDEIGDLQVWLHGHLVEARDPDAPSARPKDGS